MKRTEFELGRIFWDTASQRWWLYLRNDYTQGVCDENGEFLEEKYFGSGIHYEIPKGKVVWIFDVNNYLTYKFKNGKVKQVSITRQSAPVQRAFSVKQKQLREFRKSLKLMIEEMGAKLSKSFAVVG